MRKIILNFEGERYKLTTPMPSVKPPKKPTDAELNFSKREIQIMLNAVHERAMHLLNLSHEVCQVGYKDVCSHPPLKDSHTLLKNGSDEHFALYAKLGTIYRELSDENINQS